MMKNNLYDYLRRITMIKIQYNILYLYIISRLCIMITLRYDELSCHRKKAIAEI